MLFLHKYLDTKEAFFIDNFSISKKLIKHQLFKRSRQDDDDYYLFINIFIYSFIPGQKLKINYNNTCYTYLPSKIKYKSKLELFLTERIKSVIVIYSILNMLLISLMFNGKKRQLILKQAHY